MNEDVSPIKHGGFPLRPVSLPEAGSQERTIRRKTLSQNFNSQNKHDQRQYTSLKTHEYPGK